MLILDQKRNRNVNNVSEIVSVQFISIDNLITGRKIMANSAQTNCSNTKKKTFCVHCPSCLLFIYIEYNFV